MLQTLYVKNLALIEEAEIHFGEGLNILSGETGAGKSVLIGSIQIALGGKVPKGVIRHNEDTAYIELVFSVEEEERREALRQAGADLSGDELVISRKLTAGKSISRVNGEFWPAAKIQELTGLLLDMHGQHEHQSLLHRQHHLEILDAYCKEQTEPLKEQIRDAYRKYREVQDALAAMNGEEQARKREIAFLQFAVEEIEEANLQPGEDEELAVRYKKLVNQQQLASGITELHERLGYEGRGAAGEQIGQAIHILQRIYGCDEEGLQEIQAQLYDVESLLTDLNQAISSYQDDLENSDEELQEVESRLDVIHDLKAKYGSTIPQILDYLEEQREKLFDLQHFDEKKAELEKQQEELQQQLQWDCDRLSQIRRAAAEKMERQIVRALSELNFLQVQFEIAFRTMDHFSENGTDQVEFLISTNPGEEVKPLVQVASGGELSRIMLAIKTVLADVDRIPTLIFDEIDTGISGRTAQYVSEKLAYISRGHQVICISHLPQIVSMADEHFLIEKQSQADSTSTEIFRLSREESIEELARLLGGTSITETTLQGAREMKEQARRRKREL